ncbi:MAG: hypothetical protein ACOCQS_00525 [Bacillota bacterium]
MKIYLLTRFLMDLLIYRYFDFFKEKISQNPVKNINIKNKSIPESKKYTRKYLVPDKIRPNKYNYPLKYNVCKNSCKKIPFSCLIIIPDTLKLLHPQNPEKDLTIFPEISSNKVKSKSSICKIIINQNQYLKVKEIKIRGILNFIVNIKVTQKYSPFQTSISESNNIYLQNFITIGYTGQKSNYIKLLRKNAKIKDITIKTVNQNQKNTDKIMDISGNLYFDLP